MMPTPTREQLNDPAFTAAIMQMIRSQTFQPHTPMADLLKRPRFRRMREVHAQRARKLHRRGEYVHFLRWEHGHCIYGWGGPIPDMITINRMPRKKSEPVYTPISYRTMYLPVSELEQHG
jgi:hypothetical protein